MQHGFRRTVVSHAALVHDQDGIIPVQMGKAVRDGNDDAAFRTGDFMQEVYDLFIRDIVTTAERKNLTTKHPEFDLLMKEYRDGILLFDISNKEVCNKPMDQQAKAEAEWIEQLNRKYPVTINWKLVKKVSKMTKK